MTESPLRVFCFLGQGRTVLKLSRGNTRPPAESKHLSKLITSFIFGLDLVKAFINLNLMAYKLSKIVTTRLERLSVCK